MKATLFILFAGCGLAQGIEVPAAGAIVDSTGALRQVQGVAGSFWLGPSGVSGVLSAACSERLCLAKTDSKILSATGESDAPAGPAIFSMNGDEAVVYFPEPRLFARWHEDTLESLGWALDGEVLSIRVTGGEAEIAVRKNDLVSIVRPDGSVADMVAGANGPVLLLPEGILFATSNELVLRSRDATEVRFELSGAETITAMGAHYAAIRVGGATYALRTETGRESLFLLPGTIP